MGCDIHAMIQYTYNFKDKPFWLIFSERMYLPRNYQLFGKLADGVRGYEGLPPRGLPIDLISSDKEHLGDHSFSWCTIEEFEEAISSLKDLYGNNEDSDNLPPIQAQAEYRAVLSCMKILQDEGYKVRLVYGFDS